MKADRRARHSPGQALIEFALGLALVITAVTGGGWLLHAAALRFRCAVKTFEAAERVLERGMAGWRPGGRGFVFAASSSSPEGVLGQGVCKGGIREEVRLKKILSPRW